MDSIVSRDFNTLVFYVIGWIKKLSCSGRVVFQAKNVNRPPSLQHCLPHRYIPDAFDTSSSIYRRNPFRHKPLLYFCMRNEYMFQNGQSFPIHTNRWYGNLIISIYSLMSCPVYRFESLVAVQSPCPCAFASLKKKILNFRFNHIGWALLFRCNITRVGMCKCVRVQCTVRWLMYPPLCVV